MPRIDTDLANDHLKNDDVESATTAAANKEFNPKKKPIKCLAYVASFAAFQAAIILIFVLIIMKIRTPTFSVNSASLESFHVGGTAANPSFNLTMDAQLVIKNRNFGNYKFLNSSLVFFYGATPVGQAVVPENKAGWRSTKKLEVAAIELSSNGRFHNDSQLANELSSGVLTLNARSKLDGKVELFFIFKKKKSIDMDCTLTIGLANKALRQVSCKS